MPRSASTRWGAMGALVVLLAACGGPQSGVAPSALTPNHVIRERSGSVRQVLYVNQYTFITMLSYPDLTYIGKISYYGGNQYGEGCPDDAAGTIYFPYDHTGSKLLEYADGGTEPIGSIAPPHGYEVVNCAVDPTTHKRAVVLGNNQLTGEIGIYKPGSPKPAIFKYPNLRWYAYCRYDGTGNLFIQGETTKFEPLFLELHSGAPSLTKLSFKLKLISPSPIWWDGSRIVVAIFNQPETVTTFYRLNISGDQANVTGKTILHHVGGGAWIDGKSIVTGRCCRDFSQNYIALFPYPSGGKPQRVFKGLKGPEIIDISIAKPPTRNGDN